MGWAVVLASVAHADDMNRFCTNVPNGRFVPNPRSCQHWFFCQNGVAIEGSCAGIYQFDEDMQMCRYPEFVNCKFDAVDVDCPLVGLELHPHPQYCDQYVACLNGFPRVINCAPGLHWDQERQKCDYPENVVCVIPEPELNYVCEPDQIYVTPHPHDCQRFIVCVNGERRVNRCADTLLFDPVLLRCDQDYNVNCVLPEESVDYQCDPTRDFYFAPHPLNCNYYIMCFAGHRQIHRCADSLIFDWMHLRCDVPQNAVCLAPTV